MAFKTFEDELFPRSLRWEYALGNVAHDFASVQQVERTGQTATLKKELLEKAPKFFPEFEKAPPLPRIGVMSLLLPVACNATCPSICFTDMINWRPHKDHLSFDEILGVLREFHQMGGKLVRIIGGGEPVLYRQLPDLCSWIREAGDMNIVVFTNGVILPEPVRKAYEQGNMYIYAKLWSENVDVQNRMVAPRIPYTYHYGDVGWAPTSFYALREIDPQRVGFQVMFSSTNYEDALAIINGPKKDLPLLIEPFVPEGSGKGRNDLIPPQMPPSTKACEAPARSSYLAVVNQFGHLQAGTFVPEKSVNIVGQLAKVWGSIFTSRTMFFDSRYSQGCFCELMRLRQTA